VSGASQAFWLPKAGNSEADYEDAFSVTETRIAIADGATESSFARAWAEALVNGFAAPPSTEPGEDVSAPPTAEPWDADTLRDWIVPLQSAWHGRIAWDSLPWFAEDKARSGAFATLLTFQFERPAAALTEDPPDCEEGIGERAWRALAVGDSCLFQIRGDMLLLSFPLVEADQFNSRPLLLSSNPQNNQGVWESIVVRTGTCLQGDVFLFATDALACWFLREAEAAGKPWQTLCSLRTQSEFALLVDRLRQDQLMRNDDVTLVRVTVPGGAQEDKAAEPAEETASRAEELDAHQADPPADLAADTPATAPVGEEASVDESADAWSPQSVEAEE
jgi:hypothetical protein